MEKYTDEQVGEVTLALVCLSNVLGGPLVAMIAEIALTKAMDEGEESWERGARHLRESLISAQAHRLEQNKTTTEEEEHWTKHAKQMACLDD